MTKGVTKRLNTLTDALTWELADIYDAEHQLIERLPNVGRMASSPSLRSTIQEDLNATRAQVDRLERIFSLLGNKPLSEPCKAMTEILHDADEIPVTTEDSSLKDSVLIGILQRAKHYEIATYVTARTFAEQLYLDDIADLLQESLDEEAVVLQRLTRITEAWLFTGRQNIEPPDAGKSQVAL